MKNISILLLMVLVATISYNCSSDDSTDPITNPDPDPVANPNPNKITTYTADVKTIIDTNCLECHGSSPSQGAPMSLANYADIIDALTNQGRDDLADRMDTTGRNVMPPSGRLPQETIDIILDWKADGYKE
ncbi:c-type cytochrome [Aquimarina sp. 2304DJ70-9]|uniref:c-type cytochrome n=1 Tax=Aquimarina penaris TaxID=3231044 RepID=UPI003463275B